ncbi:MAG: DUF2147 domain-containing protein [Desulfobacteraceae bacterium]
MRRLICVLVLSLAILFGQSVLADDSILGLWKTVDDDGKTAMSHVEIYEREGEVFGKIVKLLQDPPDVLCDNCTGDKKDKPVLGMEIIDGLSKDGSVYSGGKILDPDNGKTYKCKIWCEGDTLKVRGYVAFFFRTQTWQLLE